MSFYIVLQLIFFHCSSNYINVGQSHFVIELPSHGEFKTEFQTNQNEITAFLITYGIIDRSTSKELDLTIRYI